MSLGDDLQSLKARTLRDLNAAHDYYTDTQFAWDVVRRMITEGNTFAIRSLTTNSVTTQESLLEKSYSYVAKQLAEATFQQFISIFENFFLDLLRLWLMAYPRSLLKKQIDFESVLDAPDKDAIKLLVVNKELNEVLYERPAAWFEYLEKKARLGCPTAEEIERIAEAKASRDVLIHNRGVVNNIYEAKAGKLARFRSGQRIEISEPYHRQTWELIRHVVATISDAAALKVV